MTCDTSLTDPLTWIWICACPNVPHLFRSCRGDACPEPWANDCLRQPNARLIEVLQMSPCAHCHSRVFEVHRSLSSDDCVLLDRSRTLVMTFGNTNCWVHGSKQLFGSSRRCSFQPQTNGVGDVMISSAHEMVHNARCSVTRPADVVVVVVR